MGGIDQISIAQHGALIEFLPIDDGSTVLSRYLVRGLRQQKVRIANSGAQDLHASRQREGSHIMTEGGQFNGPTHRHRYSHTNCTHADWEATHILMGRHQSIPSTTKIPRRGHYRHISDFVLITTTRTSGIAIVIQFSALLLAFQWLDHLVDGLVIFGIICGRVYAIVICCSVKYPKTVQCE